MSDDKLNAKPEEGAQEAPKPEKKDAGKIFLEEVTAGPPKHLPRWRRTLQSILVPILAIFLGMVCGGIIIIITSESVWAAFQVSIGAGLKEAWNVVATAYSALFVGAFGRPGDLIKALASGDPKLINLAIYPFTDGLVAATPYIFAGLSVAFGFRAGLFNIGAEGQLFLGAIFAAFVGYSFKGLPWFIHMPLAFLAGAVGGGLWGFIPGWLKAKTGAHEVINTIMMNYIAFRLSDWLLTGPMKRPDSFNPVSPTIQPGAELPTFFGAPVRFHLGFFIALLVAWLVSWYLFKTRWGFDLRTVGTNPRAARYAGMSVTMQIILGMTLAGALAGMAGGNEVLGVNHNLAMAFSSGYGFDAIAIALLGNSSPFGVVLASLLFGFLRSGATNMMLKTGIPIDIVSVVQAFILVFIAAPAITRTIFRLKQPAKGEEVVLSTSWGGK
ncbi:MAG: ABC transporter permease [Anaerolineales bacterium]|nr:ABC transporter permease [Anaerolineae bacterium]PWB54806.1 MAG: ABC transporter permease [Anaerolineales bacterium]